ncbi:MAG: alkaline phosphatase family protein [Bacteroidetes bacterium]|nr:alkaline phosphatase family protein [Bacteroidota bacterium]
MLAIIFAFFLTLTGIDYQETSQDRHVILISIDGFPAEMLWDNTIKLPTLRMLAEEGVWSRGLRPINPSNTWPNHVSLVTGLASSNHGVLFNGVPTQGIPVQVTSRVHSDDLLQVPTLFDLASEAGLSTAGINWPGTRNSTIIDDNLPDAPDPIDSMSEDFMWDLFDAGILNHMNNFALWRFNHAGRDSLYIEASNYLIQNRMPEFMAIHLLNVDKTMHQFGPHSPEAVAALEYTDERIASLLEVLIREGKRANTTILVVSDHGMGGVQYIIRPNILLREQGLLIVNENNLPQSGLAQVVSGGGFAMVYFEDPHDQNTIHQVKELMMQIDGIERVLDSHEFKEFGLPLTQDGQLALFAAPGYAFNIQAGEGAVVSEAVGGETALGQHGYLNTHKDMLGIFIAAGNFIETDEFIDEIISMVDIAPTIAHILGLTLPYSDGRVLIEVLNAEVLRN